MAVNVEKLTEVIRQLEILYVSSLKTYKDIQEKETAQGHFSLHVSSGDIHQVADDRE